MMKNVNLQIEVEIHPQVIWRLKLFMAIMRFAVWVGGFGGVDFEIPDRHLTPRAADVCPRCEGRGHGDGDMWLFQCPACKGTGTRG